MTCQQLVELVTEYLEGTLTAPLLTDLEEHLAACEGCETYVEHVRTTIDVLRSLRAPDGSIDPPGELLTALHARAPS
jgi:anti-sigma factor RsiW